MQGTITEEQALKKLAAMCARGEHCTGDADEKMRRWGLGEQERGRIVAKLVAAKFIDDERYTRFFVNDKIRFNHWGRRKIEQSLRLKHVDDDIISAVLDGIDDGEYLAVLRPMVVSKMKTVKAAADYERAMKTIKWAMGRGFTIDLIRKCIDEASEYSEEL